MQQIQYADGRVEFAPDDVQDITAEPETPAPSPALLRETAYRAEADQYLTASMGYEVEAQAAETAGDTSLSTALHAKAEEQRGLYLAAKSAIRTQYPENE